MGLRLARQMGLAPLPQLNPEPPEHPRAPRGVVGQWDEHKPGRPLSRVFPGCLCWFVPEGDGQRKTGEIQVWDWDWDQNGGMGAVPAPLPSLGLAQGDRVKKRD